ncbi:MAG TPA: hypothetical protein VF595_05810 [Tepidisphaeraceae bacterium]|jgi:hypothetical protein
MDDVPPTPPTDPKTLAVVLAAHRRQGYDAGYARAIADVLAASVFVAEHALRSAPNPSDARAVLYRFVADLDRETKRLASGEGVVSDGAGI